MSDLPQETELAPDGGLRSTALLSGLTTRERRLVTDALEAEEKPWLQKTEGKWTGGQWLRFKGIGLKTVKKLEKLGLVWNPPRPGPFELSVRASNILWTLDLKEDVEAVKAAVESGTLRVGKPRNMGDKTYAEIRRWVGMEPVPPPDRKWKFDPYTGKPLSPDNTATMAGDEIALPSVHGSGPNND